MHDSDDLDELSYLLNRDLASMGPRNPRFLFNSNNRWNPIEFRDQLDADLVMDLNRIATGHAWLEIFFNHAMYQVAQTPEGATIRLLCPREMAPSGPSGRSRRALQPFELRSPPNVDIIPQQDGSVRRTESNRHRDPNGDYAQWLHLHGLPSYFLSQQHLAVLRDLGPNPNAVEGWVPRYNLEDGTVEPLPSRSPRAQQSPNLLQQATATNEVGGQTPIPFQEPIQGINTQTEGSPGAFGPLRGFGDSMIHVPHQPGPEWHRQLALLPGPPSDVPGLPGHAVLSHHGGQTNVRSGPQTPSLGLGLEQPRRSDHLLSSGGQPRDNTGPRRQRAARRSRVRPRPSARPQPPLAPAPAKITKKGGQPTATKSSSRNALLPRFEQVICLNGRRVWIDRHNAEVGNPDLSKFRVRTKDGGANEWPYASKMNWTCKDLIGRLNRWRQQTLGRHWGTLETRPPRNPYTSDEIAFIRSYVKREVPAGTFSLKALTEMVNEVFGPMYLMNGKVLRSENGIEYWLRRDRECCMILNWRLTRRK